MGRLEVVVKAASVIPRQRDHTAPLRVVDDIWPQVWAALDRAKAHYDPRILDAAEVAALECCRPAAQAIANNAAPAHGLDQLQAEALAELALVKAIRQCRAWDIQGFELYVRAAVESELRNNATPAPVPSPRRVVDDDHPQPMPPGAPLR